MCYFVELGLQLAPFLDRWDEPLDSTKACGARTD